MITVGVIGASGYVGGELLRLLAGHPRVAVQIAASRAEAGRPAAALFPNLRGHLDLRFSAPDAAALGRCDIVFSAAANGVAMMMARELLAGGARLIDLAADFRLADPVEWERWYGMPHACPDLLAEAVYGLPEMNRQRIAAARIVANPGCYPTAVQLGLLPLIESGAVDLDSLIADCKSGVSGAGRRAGVALLQAESAENLKAYGVAGHRHLPEIRQGLARMAGATAGLTFVPHLIPMIRGIHATLYARLARRDIDLQRLYEERFAAEPFVDVLPAGSHPETRSVRGANVCRIAVHRPQEGGVAVALAVIDNLVKGAAGQAVQNMNLLCALDERLGLEGAALLP